MNYPLLIVSYVIWVFVTIVMRCVQDVAVIFAICATAHAEIRKAKSAMKKKADGKVKVKKETPKSCNMELTDLIGITMADETALHGHHGENLRRCSADQDERGN